MWSQINIKRVGELTASGLMKPAGQTAFEKRDPKKTYSGERYKDRIPLGPEYESKLRNNRKAAQFWDAQPPGYRKVAGWFVMSARQEATRQRRLKTLITDSAAGRRLAGLAPKNRRG